MYARQFPGGPELPPLLSQIASVFLPDLESVIVETVRPPSLSRRRHLPLPSTVVMLKTFRQVFIFKPAKRNK